MGPVFWTPAPATSMGSGTPNSGSYHGTLTGIETLGASPPWSDTSERYWWLYINAKYLDPGGTDNVYSFIFASTPDPNNDSGTWFKMTWRVLNGANKYLGVLTLMRATSSHTSPTDGQGGLGSYTFPAATRQDNLWLAFRFDKGDDAASPVEHATCKAWYYSIDDVGGSPVVGDWIEMWDVQTGDNGTANGAVTTTDTTLTDTREAWPADRWVGAVVTCNGKTMTVTTNDGDTLTGSSWSGGGNPGNGNLWSLKDVSIIQANHAFGAKAELDAKDNPKGWAIEHDDYILLEDTDGAMTKLFHTTKDIIGVQVDASVTGYDDWGVSDGAKNEARCVDDFNDSETMGTHDDDYITSSGLDDDQLFRLVDLSGSTSIDAVMVYYETRTADAGGVNKILAGCSGEGTGPTVYASGSTWHADDNAHVALMLVLTPEGSAWSEDLVNALFVGVRNPFAGGGREIRVVGIQVLGVGLTEPAANAESNTANVADPWEQIRLTEGLQVHRRTPVARLTI